MPEQNEAQETRSEQKMAATPPNLERNTLAISLLVVILGLICLPNVEWHGSTWYVLMIVFLGNAITIAWVLARLIVRRRKK
jgi:Flp pilus assembly protein TadB